MQKEFRRDSTNKTKTYLTTFFVREIIIIRIIYCRKTLSRLRHFSIFKQSSNFDCSLKIKVAYDNNLMQRFGWNTLNVLNDSFVAAEKLWSREEMKPKIRFDIVRIVRLIDENWKADENITKFL